METRDAVHLRARALDIGHGFRPATVEECRVLIALARTLLGWAAEQSGADTSTLDGAMLADRRMGLRPVKGQYPCDYVG